MNTTRKANQKKNSNTIVLIGIAALLIIGFLVFKANSGSSEKTAAGNGDLVIPKSEVTETAKFYPYQVGKTKMEVIAIKASDGTVRTALNTCQVCNGSPQAYYKQDGNVLVCQNCGNRFNSDMVEVEKGGCNPIPIMKDNKTEDGTNITISQAFLEANAELFKVWKK